jgi:hypothetical protein
MKISFISGNENEIQASCLYESNQMSRSDAQM